MVMPRSRSMSIEFEHLLLHLALGQRRRSAWISRSASVDLPWSIWAMIEKLRMVERGVGHGGRIGGNRAEAVSGREGRRAAAAGRS